MKVIPCPHQCCFFSLKKDLICCFACAPWVVHVFSEPTLVLVLHLSQLRWSCAVKGSARAYALGGKDRQVEYSKFFLILLPCHQCISFFRSSIVCIPVEGIPQSETAFFLYLSPNKLSLAVHFLSLQPILTLTYIAASLNLCFTYHFLCVIPQKCELLIYILL